jgi:hypothetical protein
MNKSKSLNELIMMYNNGRQMSSFPVEIEVWHTWIFPKEGSDRNNRPEIRDASPKWVNNSTNYSYQPKSNTSISNLYLAGAHTKTFADLYSMEAAVESGKRVADLISNTHTVLHQHTPIIMIPFKKMDSILYSMGLPSILLFIMLLFVILFGVIIYKLYVM